jgi:hypothetical protein
MRTIPWRTIAFGSLMLVAAYSMRGEAVQSQPELPKPSISTQSRGRILGIGGVFFKSANRDQMREWYSTHLGLADKGQGAMLPWREHDDRKRNTSRCGTCFPNSRRISIRKAHRS